MFLLLNLVLLLSSYTGNPQDTTKINNEQYKQIGTLVIYDNNDQYKQIDSLIIDFEKLNTAMDSLLKLIEQDKIQIKTKK